MRLHTLASGSSGNCTLISGSKTHILIDAGISCRKITTRLAQLGLSLDDLTAICITHTHADHIAGLNTLLKRWSVPIWCTKAAGEDLLRRLPQNLPVHVHPLYPGEPVQMGELSVLPFATPHDAPGSVGYRVEENGIRVAVATDFGYPAPEVLDALTGLQLALIEANHDIDWLRTGPYPFYLQERILGNFGHLCNEVCGELAIRLAQQGTKRLILGHLSKENNDPEHARQVVRTMLNAAGYPYVDLTVAPRDELSDAYWAE